MNHKQLAEDALDVAINVDNSTTSANFIARAQVHATLAQLEALEAITALLAPMDEDNSLSAETIRWDLGLGR